jgi:hypothetical protein
MDTLNDNAAQTGQVAFFLGLMPLVVAWIYSEILEFRKLRFASKAHADISLEDMVDGATNVEERSVLLEPSHPGSIKGGGAASVQSQLFKFLSLNETFLLENRLTLRAIAEFAGLLCYFYTCDRTDFFEASQKVSTSLLEDPSRSYYLFIFLKGN